MKHDKVLRRYKGLLFAILMAGIFSISSVEDKTTKYVAYSGLYVILISLVALILKRQQKLRKEAEL